MPSQSLPCPFCGKGPLAPWKPGLPAVMRCGACGGASLDPLPPASAQGELYQEDYYREGTGTRFLGFAERLVVALKGSRRRAIQARVPGPGAILDVGCGRGDLLEQFQERGWRTVGTQLSRTAAEAARRSRGVEVRVGELPELGLPEGSFDVITLFHVLEHLPDPGAYLRCAAGLLKEDGLLVVEVPNFATAGFALLGRRDLCFDHPHHLHFLTPRALEALLGRCGFRPVGRTHFSLEYSWFTRLQNALNLLPGPPNRLYRALMGNREGLALRRQPSTWIHGLLGCALALPAFLSTLPGLVLPRGNTMRLYCRKTHS